jgi:tripartite-type tricarboxylate transporter receptor subunit TctC
MSVVAALVSPWARAAEPDDFYKGRQMRFISGFDPGGAYEAYARLVSQYMERTIPGHPRIIVEMMPGAASRKAANYLYNIAPRDGSVLGMIVQGAPMDEVLKQDGVRYESSKFNWIGNPIVDNNVTIAWADSGIATFQDVLTRGGLICGGTNSSTPSITFPQLLRNMTGADIRIIPGYAASGAFYLAMQRGETNCAGGNSWSATKQTNAQNLRDRKINVLLQWGTEENAEINAYAGHEVPLVSAFAKTDIDRQALDLFVSAVVIGRPFLAPPGVPPARVDMLRRAFDAVMRDPDFIAEAKRANLDLNPTTGEKMEETVLNVSRASPAAIARAKELIEPH